MTFYTYLCGGINGLNDADCRDWREVAKSILKTETLDPMRRDYRGIEDSNVGDIVSGDLEDIGRSIFAVVNATKPSWGTAMEVRELHVQGKRIAAFIGDTKRVSPWLRYHCDVLLPTVEDACESVNSWMAVI
jgi:hypothetical protein